MRVAAGLLQGVSRGWIASEGVPEALDKGIHVKDVGLEALAFPALLTRLLPRLSAQRIARSFPCRS